MLPLLILSTLIGAVLGLRFRVMILVPAMILVAAASFGLSTANSDGPSSLLLNIAIATTALQVGYFGCSVIRFVIAGTRRIKALPSSTAAVQS